MLQCRLSLLVALLFLAPALNAATPRAPRVIYGADNRREVFEELNPAVRRLADSTVALIKTTELSPSADGTVGIRGKTFGSSLHLCREERFRDQETPAFCSGFLISPDTLITAGHCVSDALACSEVSFVFGYAYQSQASQLKSVPASDVYKCAKVIHSQAPAKGADFAILKLDRPVSGREPLILRSEGTLTVGEELLVIGHPSGLPTKIADGARARDTSTPGYFTANLDTYGGNSGSAVFNTRTLEVEGILVRGEVDFRMRPEGCMVSNVCEDAGCRGEDVTRISEVQSVLAARGTARADAKAPSYSQ